MKLTKKFPEFRSQYIAVQLDHNEEVRIIMNGTELEFTNNEFKAFTKGCNKIVSWIEEQE